VCYHVTCSDKKYFKNVGVHSKKEKGTLACMITLILMHSGPAEFLNVCIT
jgi:hypothetical protein